MRLFSLLIAASLYAQQPAASTAKPARLEGRALHANTGEPLRKVNVTITQTGARGGIARQITTEADGSFVFDSLPAGNFQLSAERNGFLPQRYASSRAQGASTVVLAAGQSLSGIDFKLVPQGAISGRVQDIDGEPMQRVQVSVLKVSSLGGRRKATLQSTAATNDLGEFRIFNLPAGRYFVSATAPAGLGGRGGGYGGGPGRQQLVKVTNEDYVPTFFPGSIDSNGAALIDLQPGREVSGLYFQLKKSPTFRIRGAVSGVQIPAEQTRRSPGVRVMLLNADKNAVSANGSMSNVTSVRADNTFEFNNIQPGQYVAVLSRFDRQQPVTLGKTPVSVSSGHIDNLNLIANDPVSISGGVRLDATVPQVDLTAIGFYLQSSDSGPGSSIGISLDEKGQFKLDAVSRDMFTLTSTGADAYYIRSIRLGSLDATELGIDLSSAGPTSTMEITLGTKPGVVTGKVKEGDTPAVGRTVTLLPDPARPLQPYLIKRGSTAEDGTFTIKGVAPGAYKIFAWEEITSDIYQDAEFMRRFEYDGAKVVVKEGSSEQVELPLMKVDK